MGFLAALAPILAEIAPIASLAGTGVSLGLGLAGAGQKPPTPTMPTPQVNPSMAASALANQQEQNPYANQGLATNYLSQLFGVGANQPINAGQNFQPSGIGLGTSNPVGNQGQYYLSDLVNQVMGT